MPPSPQGQRRTTLQEGHHLVQEEIHPTGVLSLSLGSQIILNLIATGKAAHIETVLTSPFKTLRFIMRSLGCLTVLERQTGCPCLVSMVYYTVIKTRLREDGGAPRDVFAA